MGLLLSTSAHSDNIKDLKIENISIGDSALDFFNETELVNGELDWFNYSYREFATSLVSGKGIYDWFKISYRSDDDNFKIEGLVGIVVKKKYDDVKCNEELDSSALNISGYLKILNEVKRNYTRLLIIQEKFFKRQTNQEKVQQPVFRLILMIEEK